MRQRPSPPPEIPARRCPRLIIAWPPLWLAPADAWRMPCRNESKPEVRSKGVYPATGGKPASRKTSSSDSTISKAARTSSGIGTARPRWISTKVHSVSARARI